MRGPRLFCFGLGFSAAFLAAELRAAGWHVAGTTRSPEQAEALRRAGIEVHLFTRGRPVAGIAAALAGATHLLSSVPPDEAGDPVLDAHGADIARIAGRLVWAGYLSTTGVYGDRGGGWVDEDTPPAPGNDRSRRRLAAEQGWVDLGRASGLPVHRFRLAGIYGPGRSALDQVRAGRAQRIDKPGQVFCRIHVADIAATLRASMARPEPGTVYNLADDEPAPAQEVVAYACRLLGVPPPPLLPFEQAALSPMARSFYAENRRVRNDRIKRALGVTLAFPNYRAGLEAILAGERVTPPPR